MQEINFSKISMWSVIALAAMGVATSFFLGCQSDGMLLHHNTVTSSSTDSIFKAEAPTTPKFVKNSNPTSQVKNYLIRNESNKLAERFWNCDALFERNTPRKNSFSDFLLRLELTNDHEGDNLPERMPNSILGIKYKPKSHSTTLPKNADLALFLRARYLFETDRNAIHFIIDNNIDFKYSDWAEGFRLTGSGDALTLVKTGKPENSETSFKNYMQNLTANMSPTSFRKNIHKVKLENTTHGDFLYRQDMEEAVCIVDVMHDQDSRLRFMYAQYFGQNAGIVRNNDEAGSPWFTIELGGKQPFPIYTPNCTFSSNDVWRLN